MLGGKLGRKEEIIPHFLRALALDPRRADAHNNLGKALLDLERYEEAEASLRRAIALDPRLGPAWFNLATVLFGAGRLEEAEQAYRRGVELEPADRGGLSALAFMLNYVPGRTAAEIFAVH